MFLRSTSIGILALAASVHAQNAFMVVENGKSWPVKAVHGTMLDIGPRSIPVTEKTVYSLRPVRAYRAGLVQIHSFEVQPVLQINGGATGNTANLIYIAATLSSDVPLTNFYVVLEATTRSGQKGLIYCDLPDLSADKAKTFEVRMYAHQNVSRATFVYHFFADGLEILHSKMAPAYIEEQKRRTAEFFQPDRDASPVKISPPAYPKGLILSHPSGLAQVRFTVDVTGAVIDPQVISATDPLFASAAIATVVQWKFSPAFHAHHLVPTTLEIEVKFVPPSNSQNR